MQFQAMAPALLVLSIAFSACRFATIFRARQDSSVAVSPQTIFASAVSIGSLGLAFAGNGFWIALLIVLTGALAAAARRTSAHDGDLWLSMASLAAYLQFVPAAAL
ncbi:hypothetical protein ASC97_12225 [Rhizobium sp. Root1203]|nr:hypothetical protein ASC97_12225 [Rhizobium sp. Root1203]